VVGRFVHQQDIRPPEQHTRHRDPHLPAARQFPHVAVDALVVEAKTMQHLACLALERVAAAVFVLLLHLAKARENRVHLACAGGIAHRVLQRLELVVQIAYASAAGNRLVENRTARHLLDVLAEVSDRQLLRYGDFPVVRRFLADDHSEQGRLAGAVRADQADLLAGIELE
jgi:hypothetical protein